MVMVFRKEIDEKKISLCSTYKTIKSILWIPCIRRLVFILLTMKIGFAMESLNMLKLIECGVSKEILTLMDLPYTIVSVFINL